MILIDMDGVTSDFVGGVLKLFNIPNRAALNRYWPVGVYDVCHGLMKYYEHLGATGEFIAGNLDRQRVSHWKRVLWSRVDGTCGDFWRQLAVFPWTRELIAAVATRAGKGNWAFCSTPSKDGSSCHGKVDWLKHHVATKTRNYILTPVKHALACEGNLLIDDNEGNVEDFRSGGGRAILFPQRWNANHEYAEDPLAYVLDELDCDIEGGRK